MKHLVILSEDRASFAEWQLAVISKMRKVMANSQYGQSFISLASADIRVMYNNGARVDDVAKHLLDRAGY